MHVKDHKSQLETHLKPIFFLFLLHNTIDKILYVTFWLQKKIVLGYCSLDIFIDTNQFKLQQMFLLFFFLLLSYFRIYFLFDFDYSVYPVNSFPFFIDGAVLPLS